MVKFTLPKENNLYWLINNDLNNNINMLLISMISLSIGVGDFSVWEFSGNPVYYCSYDYFAANDTTAIHLVLFSLEEPYETQLGHITYWLNLLKALTLPQDNIGEDGNEEKDVTSHIFTMTALLD